jgi:hypothetical protein
MILTIITPGVNHSWYHEPQLEKIDNRVNHNLEPRRPIKTYRIGSETLEWTHQMYLIRSLVVKPRANYEDMLEQLVGPYKP